MYTMIKWFQMSVAVAVVAVLSVGCACKPSMGRYNLTVALDPQLADSASVQVDLVGVSNTELAIYENLSVTKYWAAPPSDRETANRVKVQFSADRRSVSLTKADKEIWDRWAASKSMYVVAIADLPGIYSDEVGVADRRREVVPLDACRWDKGVKAIELEVGEKMVRLKTQPKPLAK